MNDIANVCYKNYPEIVKKYGFNGYGATYTPVINYDTTKSVLKTDTTLKTGSTNTAQIKYLQKALALFGYYKKEISGKYDNATFSAVKSYQTSRYLTSDGEAGPSTLSSIVDEIMYTQAALKYLGYYTKTANGDANEDLSEAVKWFQATESLRKNGTLNAATKNKLEQVVEDKAAGKKVNKPIDKSELESDTEAEDESETLPAEDDVVIDSETGDASDNVNDDTDVAVDDTDNVSVFAKRENLSVAVIESR